MKLVHREVERTRAARASVGGLGLLALGSLVGCTGLQNQLIQSTLARDERRTAAFEVAARALDRHPEYGDEFYRVVRRHPIAFHRFLLNFTRDLQDPRLATETAALLADAPSALERTMVSALDAARPKWAARAALNAAIVARAATMAEIVADSPPAVVASTNAIAAAFESKLEARAAFRESMRTAAPHFATILEEDPDTLKWVLGVLDPPRVRPPSLETTAPEPPATTPSPSAPAAAPASTAEPPQTGVQAGTRAGAIEW
jgi:hypothetical protein